MKDLIVYINDKSNCKFEDLQFFEASYDKTVDTLSVNFSSISKNKYTIEQLNELKNIVCNFIENKCNVDVKVKNIKFTTDKCLQKVKEIISNNQMYQMIFDISKIDIEMKSDNTINFAFVVDKDFDEIHKQTFENSIIDTLKVFGDYVYNFEYAEKVVDYSHVIDNRKQEFEEETATILTESFCKITNQKKFLGKMEEVSTAMMIENIMAGTKNSVYVAGYIKNIREINIVKKDETKKEVNFFKFELYNENSSIECVCFLKLASDLLTLKDGEQVVTKANVDSYNNVLSLRVMGVSLCKIEFPKIQSKKANKNYKYVKPIPYILHEQASFLDTSNTIKSEYLLKNTFVVFDLETTGLDTNTCKIIEIGAVKLVDGVITQQFSTFVNPMEHIPDDATMTNNITDDMVKDAPTIEQVFPDFYKFIEGSVLVAHNIAYDFPIVNRYAKKFGYVLDNEKQDTLLLAQKHLGQLKKHTLSKVCEFFNIPLIGAHRAVNDTVATAKVFVKLIENFRK